jgi:cold shock CspA family protein
MTIGTVKWSSAPKGIGNLLEGQRLSDDVARGQKGSTAAANLRQA